jgi:hypothetical protein
VHPFRSPLPRGQAAAELASEMITGQGPWPLRQAPMSGSCLLSVVVADVVTEPPHSLEITGKPPVGKVCGRPRHVEVQW